MLCLNATSNLRLSYLDEFRGLSGVTASSWSIRAAFLKIWFQFQSYFLVNCDVQARIWN